MTPSKFRDSIEKQPQIVVLAGSVTPYRNDTDRELPFRQVRRVLYQKSHLTLHNPQESNFFYLTGCTVPSSLLLLTAESATSNDPIITLFIPEVEPADLMWSVPPPTLDDARKTHDVSDVLHTSSFASSLAAVLTSSSLVHTLPQTAQFPALPPLPAAAGPSTTYLLSAMHRARLTKSAAEIALIRRANAISSRAHEVVMRVLGAGVRRALRSPRGCEGDVRAAAVALPGEWLIEKEAEAEAIFVASCRREG